ncbi:GNAT family N-acetyltransferase [Streptomyces longwoodensis]|uniref:GNAT family N-acetyltransferase n=1 Tax=Streptomyces longwoodensis TaxID=68231 RepID=UPI0036FFB4E1
MRWVDEALAAVRADEPGLTVHTEWQRHGGVVLLAMLRVPEERRGQGVARRVVETLVEAADLAGVRLAVTPTDEFGADLARLRRFYESYGFVRNTGANRNWGVTADYIRRPGGQPRRSAGGGR